MAYLERKRQQLAAMDPAGVLEANQKQILSLRQAAEAAAEGMKAQSPFIYELNRRIMEIEELAYGGDDQGGNEQLSSTLSGEDRKRFGLDGYTPEQQRQFDMQKEDEKRAQKLQAAAERAKAPSTPLWAQLRNAPKSKHENAPTWSSLSAEDRERFGLNVFPQRKSADYSTFGLREAHGPIYVALNPETANRVRVEGYRVPKRVTIPCFSTPEEAVERFKQSEMKAGRRPSANPSAIQVHVPSRIDVVAHKAGGFLIQAKELPPRCFRNL